VAVASGTTQVSQYQKGKTNLDFAKATESEWQWHQRDHMQVCTLLQPQNHASTPPLSFFTGQMPFLPPNQRQSTEGCQELNPTQRNKKYNNTIAKWSMPTHTHTHTHIHLTALCPGLSG